MDPALIDLLRKVSHGDVAALDARIAELEREIQFLRELKPLLLRRVISKLPADPLKGQRNGKAKAGSKAGANKYQKSEVEDKIFEHLFKHGPQFEKGVALALGLPEDWVRRATLDNEWFARDAENRLTIARDKNKQ